MTFTLTAAQRTELQTLRNTFPDTDAPNYSQSLNYYEMYELVYSYVEDYEVSNTLTQDEEVTKIWLEGVIGVNSGVGVQSDFIRDYNSAQKQLRYGESLTQADLDKASDDIALLVIDRVLNINEPDLPSVGDVAGDDVATVSNDYLNGDDAAWAGNPLLLFLGYDDTFNTNIIGASDPTYELLAAIKVGFDKAGNIFDPDTWELMFSSGATIFQAESLATLIDAAAVSDAVFSVNYGDFLNSDAIGNVTDLFDDVLSISLGANIVLGSVGDDVVFGFANDDAFSLDDVIHAGAGNDTIFASEGDDLLDGGKGVDWVDYSGYSDDVNINLDTHTAIIDQLIDDVDGIYNIENIRTGVGNDTLTGDAVDNQLIGNGGIDSYRLNGDFGHDTLEDDGGVLLIDGKAPIIDIDGVLLRVGSGEEQRSFQWNRWTEYTQPDGTVVTRDHIVLTELDDLGNALDNTITILDYPANRANWNFSLGASNLVQGDDNANVLLGTSGNDLIVAKEGFWDYLIGLEGDDRLIGGHGQDFMDGGEGNDIYVYQHISDSFDGGSAAAPDNDIIVFVQGEDKIDVTGLGFAGIKSFGTGADNELEYEHATTDLTFLTNTATGFYVALGGHLNLIASDFIGLADEALNLAGDNNDNAYVDSAFADDITTYGGDDVTNLSGGDDTVDGGEGNDKIVYSAPSANYQLSSLATQNITITDGVGSDGVDDISNVEVIEFSDQTLTWDGNAWIDPSAPTTVAGQWLMGTNFFDVLTGGEGNDTIFGFDGIVDFLDGRGGDDWINGGLGEDIIFYSSGNDTVDGGAGYNSFNYSPDDGIGISLLVDLAQGIAENRNITNGDVTTLANIDRSDLGGTGDHHIIGNQNDNDLSAYAGNDSLEGGAGDDTLDGGEGNDFLDGGADNDILVARSGNDTLDGGLGDDSLYGYDGQDVFTFSGNFGEDIIGDDGGVLLIDGEALLLSTTLTDTLETSSRLFAFEQEVSTENLMLTEVDTLGVVITPANSITINDYFLNEDQWNFQIVDEPLDGTTGADTLVGDAGEDTIYGDEGADVLIGDAGDDSLYGGNGNDSIIGGAGDDRSFGGDGNDTIIGNDGVDTLRGDEGSDVILGGGGDDRLLGQGGTDSIEGGEGNDWIWGNDDLGELQLDADDTLSGGNGDDTIIGDFGDDIIIGGTGKDLMRGEEGIDTFVYNSAADSGLNANNEHDVIQQFSQADGDQIDFSGMTEGTFTFLNNGNANLDFTGAGNEIAFRNLGGSSKLFVDVDGDSVTDMEINFVNAGGITFTSSDFVL